MRAYVIGTLFNKLFVFGLEMINGSVQPISSSRSKRVGLI